MSFKFSAAHSSRIKKSTSSSKQNSPFSSLPRRKPGSQASSKKKAQTQGNDDDDDDEDDDLFEDRLDDLGLVKALATDLTLRDVAQAVMYIRGRMWSSMPERAGMNSKRIAEVLNFRAQLPPIVTASHVQALLNSPTTVERETAELTRGGALRKIIVGGRGNMGEVLVLVRDLEDMIKKSPLLGEGEKEKFMRVLRERPTAMKISRAELSAEEAKALLHAGFITSSTPSWTSTEVFSTPGEGSRGTMTSLNSISRAASGSLAAVGGEGAVHAAGGSGGGGSLGAARNPTGEFSLAIPGTGAYLKLVGEARAHLRSLLVRSSRFREAPGSMLRERWDGGVAADGSDGSSSAARKRARGEFAGVLPGRTRKWKQFYGITYEWALEECVGAGMVEVFDTGSVGRGVRAL